MSNEDPLYWPLERWAEKDVLPADEAGEHGFRGSAADIGGRSLRCNEGRHDECAGQPPSPAVARFLPADMRDKKCACPCH